MEDSEREKLKLLLNYWIEHNKEHSQEFVDWADKTKGMGEEKIAKELLQAAREMDKASEILSQSLKRLGEV